MSILIKDIKKGFSGTEILKGISFEFIVLGLRLVPLYRYISKPLKCHQSFKNLFQNLDISCVTGKSFQLSFFPYQTDGSSSNLFLQKYHQ